MPGMHCIHFDDSDRALMRDTGAVAAVSPTSNLFLGSGFFDFAAARAAGMRHGLASDVGGGTSFSPFHTMLAAYHVGRAGVTGGGAFKQGISLKPSQLWWQHTAGAARAYLDAFSAAPEGPMAGDALLKLGEGLGALGQDGPPPEPERTDYCWGGCPGAMQEAIDEALNEHPDNDDLLSAVVLEANPRRVVAVRQDGFGCGGHGRRGGRLERGGPAGDRDIARGAAAGDDERQRLGVRPNRAVVELAVEHDDPVDTPRPEHVDAPRFGLGIEMPADEQGAVAGAAQRVLDAAQGDAVERAVDAERDHAHAVGAPAGQPTRHRIRHEAEFGDGRVDGVALLDADHRGAVEDSRDGAGRDPGPGRHRLERDRRRLAPRPGGRLGLDLSTHADVTAADVGYRTIVAVRSPLPSTPSAHDGF